MSQQPSMKGLLVVPKESAVRPEALPPAPLTRDAADLGAIPRRVRSQLQPLTVRVAPDLGDRLHRMSVLQGMMKQDIIAEALVEYLTKAGY